jgi:hypothetical protein
MWFRILNQPFPINTWRRYWLRGVGFGGFVFLFLAVFQPFNLHHYPAGQLLYTTGIYGLTTGIVITGGSILLIRGIAPYINEESWTLGKQILWNTFLMICITMGNILVTQWMHDMNLPFWWYFTMMKWVFMLGILPIAIAELITYNHFLHKNLRSAADMSHRIQHSKSNVPADPHPGIESSSQFTRKQSLAGPFREKQKNTAALFVDVDFDNVIELAEPTVTLTGENQGDILEIPGDSIIAVQALDNYVNVFYEHHGKLQNAMLRNTLTNIATQTSAVPQLYRSHRGWLVNTQKVLHVDGNAQGLKLSLELLPQPVPVSRSNIAGFRQVIERSEAMM